MLCISLAACEFQSTPQCPSDLQRAQHGNDGQCDRCQVLNADLKSRRHINSHLFPFENSSIGSEGV